MLRKWLIRLLKLARMVPIVKDSGFSSGLRACISAKSWSCQPPSQVLNTVTLTNGITGCKAANLLVADALQCNATVLETFNDDLKQLALLWIHGNGIGSGEIEELSIYGVQVYILEEHAAWRPYGMWFSRPIVVAIKVPP